MEMEDEDVVDDAEASDMEAEDEIAQLDEEESPENVAPTNIAIPERSKKRYILTYEKFLDWKTQNNYDYLSEDVLLEYFNMLATTRKPSSLWSIFSMLKYTIHVYHNVNIGSYKSLTLMLRKKSVGFKSKKAKILSIAEVERFIDEAPDFKYLATKVALIFGMNGNCRRNELCSITLDDIEDHKSLLIVSLSKKKTSSPRSFSVFGKYYDIYKKYAALRPKSADSKRFFMNYQKGKCFNQVIGINKFGQMPKDIASFLGLRNPEEYNTHSFRNTSTTFFVDFGAQLNANKASADAKQKELDRQSNHEKEETECDEVLEETNDHVDTNSESNFEPIVTESYSIDSAALESVINVPNSNSPIASSETTDDKSKTNDSNSTPKDSSECMKILSKMLDKFDKRISFNFTNCPDISIHIHKYNE